MNISKRNEIIERVIESYAGYPQNQQTTKLMLDQALKIGYIRGVNRDQPHWEADYGFDE